MDYLRGISPSQLVTACREKFFPCRRTLPQIMARHGAIFCNGRALFVVKGWRRNGFKWDDGSAQRHGQYKRLRAFRGRGCGTFGGHRWASKKRIILHTGYHEVSEETFGITTTIQQGTMFQLWPYWAL
ncbi:uncharacterized protein TM35_000311440 [Trypanosoma theileri]|uniref:Uncharacterized protein n=1 Tax=Trypanosoma theileri TaxID=67003 RepID=A0A1X0NN93_9TRYP|nr:uncharacterized protein TM35_000311440 [Trypanosoma theileri]ORC85958.1 hypothetical protein TM35_000311440 [Trypanosoma theileri]